ncbi:peptidase inhibitor 16 [Danio aesculapii]|uniref:peptidase inhibitor 16 n=1 Tax=Danio aesculapii TaxID=1142201 RepID=UPI0024C06304|nr:peptidase inhibitor 16 [Danio aesculapii]
MYRDMVLRSAGLWVILSLAVGQLTEQEILTIVDLHNELRSQVQPSAAFMQKVVWDEAIRLVAEGYAAKCIWDHNPELEDLTMGENLFVGTGPFNATKAVMDWFNENLDYDYDKNDCADNKMCGHYTQLVWANTTKIGCATYFCDTLEQLDFEKATLLVCDYYPHGNIEGQKPYESGESCSKCPDEKSECENNICVVENLFPPSEEPDIDPENPTVLPDSPHIPENPAVLPESTQMSTVPNVQELTEVHVEIEERDMLIKIISQGSTMQSVSAPLLMLFWLLAAFIL